MQKNKSVKQDRRNQVVIAQRRKQVSQFIQANLSETEIAQRLGVDVSTVSRDITALKEEANDWIHSLAKDSLAHMYRATFEDLNRTRLAAWDIYNKCNQEDAQDNSSDSLSLARIEFSIGKQHNQHKNRDMLNALKVVIQANVSMFELLQAGPIIMAVKGLDERVERLEKTKPKATPLQQEVTA
ncbi:MAG TPA: HTH domain-containing protein [Nitrososphaera sp.]|jgi:predicted transcriptional regulator